VQERVKILETAARARRLISGEESKYEKAETHLTIGVPVRHQRRFACNAHAALAFCVSRFLIKCASSRTAQFGSAITKRNKV
jgi:hypothetical protein